MVRYIIGKAEIESVYQMQPNITQKEMAKHLGVCIKRLRKMLQGYGFIKKRKPPQLLAQEYNHVTEEEVKKAFRENKMATVGEIADMLGASLGVVEKVRMSGDFEPLPKGRRIPHSDEELKEKILKLILTTKGSRQSIAEQLNVSPPTILNYVKILKEEGRLEKSFSFRPKKKTQT